MSIGTGEMLVSIYDAMMSKKIKKWSIVSKVSCILCEPPCVDVFEVFQIYETFILWASFEQKPMYAESLDQLTLVKNPIYFTDVMERFRVKSSTVDPYDWFKVADIFEEITEGSWSWKDFNMSIDSQSDGCIKKIYNWICVYNENQLS